MNAIRCGLGRRFAAGISTAFEDEFRFNAGGKGSIFHSVHCDSVAGRRTESRPPRGCWRSDQPAGAFLDETQSLSHYHLQRQGREDQAGVFELGKDIVRTMLKVLEVRTGKEIEFQDLEAWKQYRTPKECEATE